MLQEEYEQGVRAHLRFMPWVPVLFVSALEGSNVSALVDMALEARKEKSVFVLSMLICFSDQCRETDSRAHAQAVGTAAESSHAPLCANQRFDEERKKDSFSHLKFKDI